MDDRQYKKPLPESGPYRAYIFRPDGYHEGYVEVPEEKIVGWLQTYGEPAYMRGLEVVVTDSGDNCVFHAKDRAILWPDQREIDLHRAERQRQT